VNIEQRQQLIEQARIELETVRSRINRLELLLIELENDIELPVAQEPAEELVRVEEPQVIAEIETIVREELPEEVQEESQSIQEIILAPKKEELPKIATEEKVNLNEKLAKLKTTPTSVEAFAGSPIADLKKAITLNQKLAFIKNLFGGDATYYNDALNILNTCGDWAKADAYIQSLKLNTNDTSFAEWQSLIKRRWS
jgi:hypothetical protein